MNYARYLGNLDFLQPTQRATPTQNYKIYFDQFTHHFENPHRYQNVRNKIFFHFRYKSSTHALSRPRKIEKTENKPLVWLTNGKFGHNFIFKVIEGPEIGYDERVRI